MMLFMKKKEKNQFVLTPEDQRLLETFGKNVKTVRKSKKPKLTSEKMAEKAGISYGWVSEIENARSSVSLVIASRIARVLETSIDALTEQEMDIDKVIE